jgi:hypothetical protein
MAVPLVTQSVWPIGEHQTPHGQPRQFDCWATRTWKGSSFGEVAIVICGVGMRCANPSQVRMATQRMTPLFEHMPTSDPQHVRFCSALRCHQKLSPGKQTATAGGQDKVAAIIGVRILKSLRTAVPARKASSVGTWRVHNRTDVGVDHRPNTNCGSNDTRLLKTVRCTAWRAFRADASLAKTNLTSDNLHSH